MARTGKHTDAETLVEVLHDSELGIELADLTAAVTTLRDHGLLIRARQSKAVLSESAAQFLASHGGLRSTRQPEIAGAAARRNVARVVTEMALLVGGALTGALAAEMLGVAPATVRDRKRDGRLYALPAPGGSNRFPRWQFVENGPHASVLPHLADVLEALPVDMHPLEVQEFFTQPRSWLTIDGERLSAADWLAAGGDVQAVLRDAESVGVLA